MPETSREYGEGREPMPAIGEPTVIFMINKSMRSSPWSDEHVYSATRRSWSIRNGDIRDRAVYALGVSHGVVRGAYRVERWHHDGGTRWSFDGQPAPDLGVVDTSVARLKGRKGDANPVRWFPDGVTAPSLDDK